MITRRSLLAVLLPAAGIAVQVGCTAKCIKGEVCFSSYRHGDWQVEWTDWFNQEFTIAECAYWTALSEYQPDFYVSVAGGDVSQLWHIKDQFSSVLHETVAKGTDKSRRLWLRGKALEQLLLVLDGKRKPDYTGYKG